MYVTIDREQHCDCDCQNSGISCAVGNDWCHRRLRAASIFGVDGLLLSCGSLNVAIGMALLQMITQGEEARRFFYDSIKPHEDYFNLGMTLLWGIPSHSCHLRSSVVDNWQAYAVSAGSTPLQRQPCSLPDTSDT